MTDFFPKNIHRDSIRDMGRQKGPGGIRSVAHYLTALPKQLRFAVSVLPETLMLAGANVVGG